MTNSCGQAGDERGGARLDALRLLDCVDDAIMVLDGSFALRYANAAVAEFLEPGTDETTATLDPSRIVHPDDLCAAIETFAALAGTGDRSVIRLRVRSAEGWRPVEATLTDCTGDAGVGGVVICFRNLTAEERYRESLDAQMELALSAAMTDSLTGLPNRRLLVDRLGQSIERSRRTGQQVALMFVDLDGFKAINDGRGHEAGDRVLIEVARRIRAEIRGIDTAARLGGDEFVVVLEEADRRVADDVAERLLDSLARDFDLDDRAYALSATVGVAIHDGTDRHATTPEELVRRADIAMYSGKADGRNRVVFFEDWMGRAAEARAELEAELRRAVGDGTLQVAYQPVFRTADRGLHGFEALARWVSPTQGMVPPAEFIPLAARLGMARRLDLCVLEQACAAMVALGPAGHSLELTVNLAPQHIDDPDLVDGIVDVLHRTQMPPRRLLLEITETDALRDPDGAVERLQALRALGARLAIDDFGTGYSSMTYLDRFPIDVVKIDRSFIAAIDRSRRARRLTESVVDLAHSLGLEVVAEGVETAEQAEVVTLVGADLVQGFHYRRPGPERAMQTLVRRQAAGTPQPPTTTATPQPAATSNTSDVHAATSTR
ncbi:MAG: bifunctional diguanylate cyclase/phosphodiesterase [Acidimicrobiales bacterium]